MKRRAYFQSPTIAAMIHHRLLWAYKYPTMSFAENGKGYKIEWGA